MQAQISKNEKLEFDGMNVLDSIVRVISVISGKCTGTGFVVSHDGLIITCAHVCGAYKPEKVFVVFEKNGARYEATVLNESWRGVDAEDVALLRISGALPEGVQPLPLGSSRETDGHKLLTFGYPGVGEVQGVRGTGVIVGYGPKTVTGQSLLQLRSNEITEGFSGAPVWDLLRRRVVGMVTIAARSDRLGKLSFTAFATPVETLRTVCPQLRISDINPYRNLASFRENDADFFFGRETAIEALIQTLGRSQRFLLVIGHSGSGKSSVVQAGLIPQLRKGALPFSTQWEIILTRPTDFSFEQQLIDVESCTSQVALVIDQFEELFVSFEIDIQAKIIARFVKLLEYFPHVIFIIVMRSDFYNHLARYERMKYWIDSAMVYIPPVLQRKELESIVSRPASVAGWQFEDGLVDLITNEMLTIQTSYEKVSNSTHLPLLEFALTQLWEASKEGGILTREAYHNIGGVTGSLVSWAEQIYTSFEDQLRPLVEHIFKALVHLGDPDRSIPDICYRRNISELVRISDAEADIDYIVRQLVDKHLLAVGRVDQSQSVMVEIIHDTLLWRWGRLQYWISEDRSFLLWQQVLHQRATEWRGDIKPDKGKLLTGSDLKKALKEAKERRYELTLTEDDFIQQSQRRHRRTRRTLVASIAGLSVLSLGVDLGVNRLLPKQFTRVLVSPPPTYPYKYTGHSSWVMGVAWSSNGMKLASAGADNTVQVWQPGLKTPLFVYKGHSRTVTSVAWSPDSKRLASGAFDKTVQVWEPDRNIPLFTYKNHTDIVSSVAWSPDGKRIASGGFDKTVQVWEPGGGTPLFTYKGHTDVVLSVAWSPDGKRIASAGVDKTVQVWVPGLETPLFTYRRHTDKVWSVAWSDDGKRLISTGEDSTVRVWEPDSGKFYFGYRVFYDKLRSVAWSPNNKLFALAGSDAMVQVREANKGILLFDNKGHTSTVTGVAWSHDSAYLASSSEDTTVRVWKVQSGSMGYTYRLHSDIVMSIAWSPTGTILASAGRDHTVQLVVASSGTFLASYPNYADWGTCVAWSSDGKRLASASLNDTVQVWEPLGNTSQFTYKGHSKSVLTVAWSPDGKRLASGGYDNTVQVWEPGHQTPLFIYKGHTDVIRSVAWSPDGKYLASAASDKTVQVWEPGSGIPRFTYKGHTKSVWSVAWSPDGRRIASASLDNTVQIWEPTGGASPFTYKGHNASVMSVAWSPDGRHLASAGADKTAQVWKPDGATPLFTYEGHTSTVSSVVWSPEGKRLASAGADTTVQVWLWLES